MRELGESPPERRDEGQEEQRTQSSTRVRSVFSLVYFPSLLLLNAFNSSIKSTLMNQECQLERVPTTTSSLFALILVPGTKRPFSIERIFSSKVSNRPRNFQQYHHLPFKLRLFCADFFYF